LPNQVNNNNMPGLNAPADNAGFRFQPSPEYQLPTNTVQQQRQSPVVPPVHTYNQGIAPVQMQQQPQMQQQQSYPQQIPQVQPQNNMPIIKEVSNTVQVRPIGRSVTQPIKPQPINVGSFYGR
jgi:hypothetical protein